MVHGAGIGSRNPASAVKDAAVTAAHWKTHEEEDENAAVEGAHRAELVGESLARKSIYMRERLKGRREESRRLKESVLDEAERSRLIFETAYGNEAKDAVKREAEKKKKSALQKLFQKKRYQKQYQAARQSKKVKDAAITSAQKFTEKAKDAVKMVAAQNRGIFATVAVFALIFVLIAASFTSCTASLQGASSAIISTSYSSTDEDIYAAENAYRALEEALNTQINQMESTHPDYDEYRYQIDEIGHNPYQLISYLTVKYGGFTYDEVAEEIKEIFRQQYGITTDSTRETVTETKTVRVGESLGLVVTSGYCNCPICCGQWSGGPTASGAMPTANHTIAVDAANPFVPIGTHVVMNGVEYVVEDTGAFARYGVQFDVYYDNHAAASAHGHLTWVAYIGGKRESRRLMGDLVLREQDILNNIQYEDATFTTTWGIDLHYPKPIPGIKEAPFLSYCDVQDIKPYAVPYRCLYSRNIENLFMAGRNISVTHIVLGTVRVMRTGGMMGEVVGMAASLCKKHCTNPRYIYLKYLSELKTLMKRGIGKPGFPEAGNIN